MGWIGFAAAFGVFFLSHSLPLKPAVRARLQARLGRAGFSLAYSALSLAVLAWLIAAAGRAPVVPLWGWAPWQSQLALGVMAVACLILALSIGWPNPFSFGGARNARFDPEHPGILRWSRHPLLLALTLWALAHALVNGDLAHVILFASLGAFSVLGGRLIDRRKRRESGAEWHRLRAALRSAPLWPRPLPGLRLLAGVVLYAALIMAHPLVIGVDPLP